MKIQVTESDIRTGVRCSDRECPIALAAKRAFGEDLRVGNIWITLGDRLYRLPSAAIRFLYNFDFGDPVEPFEFEVAEPKEFADTEGVR